MQTFTDKVSAAINTLWSSTSDNPLFNLGVDISARLIAVGVILAILLLIRKLLDSLVVRFFRQVSKGKQHVVSENRLHTLMSLSRSIVRYGIYFIGALTILPEFGVNVSALLTAAGVGGLAIGFGAQNLVRDVIAGFFILMEGQFDVGDFVSIADREGIVENIGLRTTTLKDFTGSRHIIPNGEIKSVTNNMGSSMRVQVDFSIGFENNLDYVREVLESLCEEYANKIPALIDPPRVVGIQSFSDAGLVVRVRASAEPLMQWTAERQLREAIYKGLKERGVVVSYPHVQVLHEEKGGIENG
ncbi:MAG TPA: mechanosensitive ion channel family protein [Firmicutes bacterium]|jgi:small-conductance mechanosensitive channel|nr:mechanosensitive ion channel family protein [Bacillota bacterium]